MITIQITAEQIERAKQRYDFEKLKGSVMNGASNIYGALGEIIYLDFLTSKGFKIVDESTYDYDFICNGFKIDIKSSKLNKVNEKYINTNIECRLINHNQNAHFYFFCKISEDFRSAYLLGYISKKEFIKQAIFTCNGQASVRGDNFNYRGDGWHIYHKDLNSFKIN